VGWVQMDHYFRDAIAAREATLADLGLPSHARYILFGSSPERLGHNEPAICDGLSGHLARQKGAALVIRCHANDRKWHQRFRARHTPPHTAVRPRELCRMHRMADQITHAASVLSPAGSILLDAIGLDTPAIALAFENEEEPYYDRLARRYDMEHLRSLSETGG